MTDPQYRIYFDHEAEDPSDRYRICELIPGLKFEHWEDAKAQLGKLTGVTVDQEAAE